MLVKFSSVAQLFLVALQLQPTLQGAVGLPKPPYGYNYPTRKIAGVSVIDTPIVRDALEISREHSGGDFGFKHVMRTWLFGATLIAKNETLRRSVDLEVHAVAVLLHDLGWDRTPGSQYISTDKRFEVDGAIASREFIRGNKHGKKWDEKRVQLVWDAIALHTEQSFFPYKELDVASTGHGILMDFLGPNFGVTQDEYDAIVAEYPRDELIDGFVDTITWLCRSKPKATYDTWQQPFGERFVANYSAIGNRVIDNLLPK